MQILYEQIRASHDVNLSLIVNLSLKSYIDKHLYTIDINRVSAHILNYTVYSV